MKKEEKSSVFSYLLGVILLIVIGMNLYILVARTVFKNPFPLTFGFGSAVVVSGSMSGTIEIGDLVIVRKAKDYQIDDIVTYSEGGRATVTHRIVEKKGRHFVTQGDANNTVDSEINDEQIYGRVVAVIPKVGKIIEILKSPIVLLLIICLFIFTIARGTGGRKELWRNEKSETKC